MHSMEAEVILVGSMFNCTYKFIVKNMLTNHDFCMKMSVPAVSK